MIGEIQTAIAGLKSAAEIINALYAAKLDADTKAKVSALQGLIIDARQSAFNAQEELSLVKAEVADLKRQIVEFEEWGKESKRYQLFKPADINGVVYALKEADSAGEPAHYLCTSCYQTRRKSILNNEKDKEGWTLLSCPVCNAKVPSGYRGPVAAVYVTE